MLTAALPADRSRHLLVPVSVTGPAGRLKGGKTPGGAVVPPPRRAWLSRASRQAERSDSRNCTTASLKRSLRSPATMCPAPATSTRLRVRHQLEQLLRALFAEQVADASAHQQRRDGERARGLPSRSGSTIDERVSSGLPSRPPMNAGSQCQYQRPSSRVAQVLLQPLEIGRAGAVRVVGLDRVGDLVERREAVVHVLGHERADAHRGPAPPCGARRRRARARARRPRRGARRSRRATRCRRATRRRARAARRTPREIATTSPANASSV